MNILLLLVGLNLVGCGEVSTEDNGTDTTTTTSNGCSSDTTLVTANGTLTLSGKISFEKVGVKSTKVGLDYNNIMEEPARQIVVKAIGSCGEVITSTTTDDSGEYELKKLPEDAKVKVRAYAMMKEETTGNWDVKVLDNTNGNAQYVMEGSLVSVGTKDSRRSLVASLGWNNTLGTYTGERTSAPFAILDSIYIAMQKVLKSDSQANFPELLVHWSTSNVPSGNATESELKDGLIATSHFDGEKSLYILGDANTDTDEFDDHIIIHEWGHYFEAKFSRADSIGGPHGEGEHLDIRVAFGEGWGNAWSAIATDDTTYFDSLGNAQSSGWSMDIESEPKNEAGWYSEASIQRILYDLYDSNNDSGDRLSLGFQPMYSVLTGAQKATPAFTSIFSFITALKAENSLQTSKIDDILRAEDIGTIDEIYGSDHHTLYSDMQVGDTHNVCTSTEFGIGNKLNNHKYIRFTVNSSDSYRVRVSQSNGSSSDPDFSLFKTVPFTTTGVSQEVAFGVEEQTYSLSAGNYLLDISDYNDLTRACFNISVTKTN